MQPAINFIIEMKILVKIMELHSLDRITEIIMAWLIVSVLAHNYL